MTNLEIAALLRKIAAAYLIQNENRFKIIAYEKAADNIEQLTEQVEDIWKEGKLDDIGGVGKTIASHLNDLFTTGKVQQFEQILSAVPASIFPLLLVPGIGPKKAYRLVTELHLDDEKNVVEDLEKAANAHKIAELEGFGEKSEADIVVNIEAYKRGQIKEHRILISEADRIASEVMDFLRKETKFTLSTTLGSLRRRVSTIGDIDIAVATRDPKSVIDRFVQYPHQKLIEQGPTGASLLLHNGRQVDLRVQLPELYGAMLQYFTGSKAHNIRLREHALSLGYSLNEYGLKVVGEHKKKAAYDGEHTKKGVAFDSEKQLYTFQTEEGLYNFLGLEWVPPEIREDRGEVDAALGTKGELPKLVHPSDIRGDVHLHSSYDLSSSHDIGANSIEENLDSALSLGYEYMGFSDHNPSVGNHSAAQIAHIMEKRMAEYTRRHDAWKKIVQKAHPKTTVPELFVMCEVDILPDGELALPPEAFEFVDAVVVSIHSSFSQSSEQMTARVVRALQTHPKVRIFGHPTGRLLGKRDSVAFKWSEIYAVCKERDIALEINANPSRLDVSDAVVYEARQQGIRFCIDTDAHAIDQLLLMPYGVDVARRGWATPRDILNTIGYTGFSKWLKRT